jgi:hypothetical protein
METTLTDSKREITDWINSIEDKNLLDKIVLLMNESKSRTYYTEEEARKISKEKIAQWFGK